MALNRILLEDNRNQLLAKSRYAQNYKDKSGGKNRYERRTKSKISNSVKEYNKIDMTKFFEEDILDLALKVHGETDDYLVSISFSNLLNEIKKKTEANNGVCDLRTISQAAIKCFNQEKNIYVRCSCPDWAYRFSYYASLNNIIYGDKENRPSNKTNPDDKLGSACKHVLLVLSNISWLSRLSSTIWNYINYVQKHYEAAYAEKIYPKIYGKPYEDDTQLGLFDDEAMNSDEETIDKSNEEGKARGQFKQGNTSGIRFMSTGKQMKGQQTLDLDK